MLRAELWVHRNSTLRGTVVSDMGFQQQDVDVEERGVQQGAAMVCGGAEGAQQAPSALVTTADSLKTGILANE
ncbi:hypothetical protein D3C79_891300 [compost metagenome]